MGLWHHRSDSWRKDNTLNSVPQPTNQPTNHMTSNRPQNMISVCSFHNFISYIKEKLYPEDNRYKELYIWTEKIITDVLFLSLCTLWMWAMLPTFWRYKLPPSWAVEESRACVSMYTQVLTQQTPRGEWWRLEWALKGLFLIFSISYAFCLNQEAAPPSPPMVLPGQNLYTHKPKPNHFYPGGGDSMYLWNVGNISTSYNNLRWELTSIMNNHASVISVEISLFLFLDICSRNQKQTKRHITQLQTAEMKILWTETKELGHNMFPRIYLQG